MSSCEKCWADSRHAADPARYYAELVQLRRGKEFYCTAEEQAGPDAGQCQRCERWTLHQYTGEPMCGCEPL